MMKRIAVCALLMSGLLFGATPAAAQSTAGDATAVLKRFYDWYLRQPNHEWMAHYSQMKIWLDPTLYTMLQTVLRSEANQREAIIDFDPFVNAQYDAVAYAFGTAQVKNNAVNVPVTLTLSGRQTAKTHLTAVLRKGAGGKYVIYNFVYDPKFNFRHFLSKFTE